MTERDATGTGDADEVLVRRSFWRKVRKTLGQVAFIEDAVAGYFCAVDKATPASVKLILFGALAYFVIPTDLLPDFIPGLGYTDDATVIAAALAAVARYLKPVHRERARSFLDKEGT